MSVELTPSKRPYEEKDAEENGNKNCPKSEGLTSKDSPLNVFPVGNLIRVLFPVSRMDSLIGDDGKTISQIRQDCGVNVQVEEFVPGCDETVIIISGSDKDVKMGSEQAKADGDEPDKSVKGNVMDENDNNKENKQSVLIENPRAENNASSIHKAVLILFENLVRGQEMSGREESDNKSPTHVMRLIVHSSQVSGLLGKNGSVIKQMSSESGAEIKILPRDKLPLCASSNDDLVQISGELDVVRKALQYVCKQLVECSFNQDTPSDVKPSRDFCQSDHSSHGQGPPYSAGYRDEERGFSAIINPPDTLSFRLLCPEERVGGLIGKGGTIINALQHETGCEIKIFEGVADSDDREILISGPAHPEDRSAILDAVLRVHARISRIGESNERSVTAKILVSSNQIGCLLGKGGAIISDMRKSSGANIRILGKEHISKNYAENDEVVQINGGTQTVHEALVQIIVRLLDRFFRDAFPPNHVFPEKITPFSASAERMGYFSPSRYPNMGRTLNQGGGLRPHVGGPDGGPPFAHDFRPPGIPERMQSSAPWGPQGIIDGGGPMGFPDYLGAPSRRGGFVGANHPAIITNTTMEVVVPHSVVPAIYGVDGGCLRQICEISDARITITDTKPGATETVIIISGTPEQANAAQSLIQAFVISETEAP